MKKTDIAMIVLIATASIGIAYFLTNSLLGGVAQKGVKVQTIDVITSTVESPNSAIFNQNAINPSVEVTINNTTAAATTTTTTPTKTTTAPATKSGSTQ